MGSDVKLLEEMMLGLLQCRRVGSDVMLLEMFGLLQFQRVGSDVKLLEMFGLFQRVGQ